MLRFISRRLLLALLVALATSLATFVLLRAAGDAAAAIAGPDAPPEEIEAVRHLYGLDRPVLVQYLDWAAHGLTGDLGESLYFRQPVVTLIGSRLGTTLLLATSAFVLIVGLALPLGVLAAARPRSWVDRMALLLAVVGQAVPSFWLALLAMVLFGVVLGWLPVSGSASWRHFVLPAAVLALGGLPAALRLTRAGMLDALGADYVRVARAKGMGPGRVLIGHALRNAIVPVVSLAAVQYGGLLNGAVVIETIFSIRGLGYLAYESVIRADVAVLQATVVLFSFLYIALTLLADLAVGALDPRIRQG